jgi:hypothetical protein
MNMTLVQIVAAIAMVGVAVALTIGYRQYLVANSERRMRTMLKSIGLDPALVTIGDVETIMKEARRRCRSCASEDRCERWLKREVEGDNSFCPNSKMFEALRKHVGTAT